MSDPTDQRLRAAFLAQSQQGDHVGADLWEQLLDRGMTVLDRGSVSDHLTSCRVCALVYRGLLEFEAQAHEFDPAAPRPRPRVIDLETRSTRGHWLSGLGAGLALAAGIVIGVGLIRARPEAAQFRGANTAGNDLRLVPPDGALDAQGRISWTPAPNAAAYAVTVFAEDGRVTARTRVQGETSLAWPAEARVAGIYFWSVSVVDPESPEKDGPTITSPLARVEIRP